jgi:hypothetical protein
MKTIRNDVIGKNTLRLVDTGKGFVGLVIAGGKQLNRLDGDDPVQLWADLCAAAGRTSDAYFGFDGARARFRQFFPDGFRSPAFEEAERNYKLKAKAKLDETAPLEQALTSNGLGEAVLSAYRGTNLLSPFEKTRLQPLLRGPDADPFIQAAARFTIGENEPALATMERLLNKHDNAKWTVVTYLPFLWRPDEHMFLKPMVTQQFAERVGHSFAHEYSPALEPAVYASLRDLMAQTVREVADLGPSDNIDLQSFVWTVGEYQEGDVPVPAQTE